MTLKIVSTADVLFEGSVTMVTLPGAKGRFTVLRNHAALISVLTAGKITFRGEDVNEQSVDISGGIVDVDNNVISVCVTGATAV